jgi:hypothetical protein
MNLPHSVIHGITMARRTPLLLAVCLCGCVAQSAPDLSTLVDPACARQCEQIYWTCKSSCPRDIGGAIGCSIASCVPARNECLRSCPGRQQIVIPKWKRDIGDLSDQLNHGEITDEQYMQRRDEILKAVPASGRPY